MINGARFKPILRNKSKTVDVQDKAYQVIIVNVKFQKVIKRRKKAINFEFISLMKIA